MKKALLKASHISVRYPLRGGFLRRVKGYVHAVENLSLEIYPGEIVALVGESGCGKSTVGRSLLALTKTDKGELELEGRKIDRRSFASLRRSFQIIFQDPYLALNPRQSIYEILAEALIVHKLCPAIELKKNVRQLLDKVGISSEQMHRYPHAFSGGQRQRICIARAISMKPKFIVCDEIVSALDLSVQAQILQLLLELKAEMRLALLWISHDLSLVRYVSSRMYVMYKGRIVESGPTEELFRHPAHPYTLSLLKAVPTLERGAKKKQQRDSRKSWAFSQDLGLKQMEEQDYFSSCAFVLRCPQAQRECQEQLPLLQEHRVRESQASGAESQRIGERKLACFSPLPPFAD